MLNLRNNLEDREFDKFELSPEGETLVRTTARGSFAPSGLTKEGKITRVEINDSSWTAIPLVALTDRNALSIQNRTGFSFAINFNSSAVYADSWLVEDGFDLHWAIKDNIIVYAKGAPASGANSILVMELA